MKANFHRRFNKQFKDLSARQQNQAKQAIALFLKNSNHPLLRNHPLKGKWLNYRSISAAGDLRLHYRVIDKETVLFVSVGTHSQLYK